MGMKRASNMRAIFNRADHRLQITLNILIFEEDNTHFVYSPALDLTGYGIDEQGAQASFSIVLEEFVKYTENKKTIYKELERLGWKVNERRKKVSPPLEQQLLDENETYRELKANPNVVESKKNVQLALA